MMGAGEDNFAVSRLSAHQYSWGLLNLCGATRKNVFCLCLSLYLSVCVRI